MSKSTKKPKRGSSKAAEARPSNYTREHWSFPMNMPRLALVLGVPADLSDKMYRSIAAILRPHRLRNYFKNRQLFECCLDSMNASMRKRFEEYEAKKGEVDRDLPRSSVLGRDRSQ